MSQKKEGRKRSRYQRLKGKVIRTYQELLDTYEEDIETGIQEGIYIASENVQTRKFIQKCKEVLAEFTAYQPCIYVFVEGGNIQGASATEPIGFNLYDKDNLDGADDKEQEFLDTFGSPSEWDAKLKSLTKSGHIIPIY